MRKIVNDDFASVEDTLAGILKAHADHPGRIPGSSRALMRSDAPVNGGSGHLPVFPGCVDRGLCCAGAVAVHAAEKERR